MDTLTHGLFGFTLYQAAKKEHHSKKERHALLFTALVGSQIPDIDVIADFTETGAIMSQMWHRGITHSIFLVPIWALLIYWLCRWFFKTKDIKLLFLATLAVLWHDTTDLANAWGTGYLEPFSPERWTLGTIPIIDFVFWALVLVGFLISKIKKQLPTHLIFRWVAVGMIFHLTSQTTQGMIIEQEYQDRYEQTELAATFIPWTFQVITKQDNQVLLFEDSLFSKAKHIHTLQSQEQADLTPLFEQNPKARVLYDWSPFVVIVDDADQLGIYDPRFYQDGGSFLAEYIKK